MEIPNAGSLPACRSTAQFANCSAETALTLRRLAFLTFALCAVASLAKAQSVITTIGGNGGIGYGGDGGAATSATLGLPGGVAVDPAGNVYIADGLNSRIRKVDTAGVISTFAGNGFPFFGGDGGAATSASVSLCATAQHSGIASDKQGNIYIADCRNNRIRKVDTAGIITTVAGIGGTTKLSGDGGPATSATLGTPYGVAVDANGNIYIADTGNGRVRKVDAGTGIITTVAGTTQGANLGDGGLATNAQLANPDDVAVDSKGNIYIADYGNGKVRKVNAAGIITSVPIPGIIAVASLALDSADNLYVSAGVCVNRVSSSGVLTCVAGGGFNIPGDGGPPTSAGLGSITGIAFDSLGQLYISDSSESRIRLVTLGPSCSFLLDAVGQAFPAEGGSGVVTITAGAGCAWSATGAPSWITFAGASSGAGNGVLNFTVAANSGAARAVTLSVSGVSYSVEEAAALAGPGPGFVDAGSFAQVVSGGGWTTAFTYVNVGLSPAQARTTFFANSGTPLLLPFTFPQLAAGSSPLLGTTFDRSLNPNASLLFSTSGADNTTQKIGWGAFASTGAVSGFAIFRFPALNWNAVVPLESRNAPLYLLAFDNTGALATGVAIANLSSNPANVNMVFRDDNGTQLDAAAITLPAHGHNSFMLNTTYVKTNSIRGTVEFDTPSGGQISVLGLRANGPALTTLPVLASVGTSGGSLTHATFNGGFNTLFTLVNTGSSPAPATLNFFGDSGAALPMQLVLPQTGTQLTASTITRTLAPGASLLVQAQGQNSLAAVVGSAQLSTTGNVSGFAIFNWTTFGQEASVPLETRNPGAFVLPFDNTGGVVTGVALANVAGQAANIQVTIRDDAGSLLGNDVIQLAANGHASFVLGDKYSAVSGKRGIVQFDTPSGGRISVLGLLAKADGTLTTIPVLSK